MIQVVYAKDSKVVQLTSVTKAGLVTAFDTWKAANPNAVICNILESVDDVETQDSFTSDGADASAGRDAVDAILQAHPEYVVTSQATYKPQAVNNIYVEVSYKTVVRTYYYTIWYALNLKTPINTVVNRTTDSDGNVTN